MLRDPFPSNLHHASCERHPIDVQMVQSRNPKGKLVPELGLQSHKRLCPFLNGSGPLLAQETGLQSEYPLWLPIRLNPCTVALTDPLPSAKARRSSELKDDPLTQVCTP